MPKAAPKPAEVRITPGLLMPWSRVKRESKRSLMPNLMTFQVPCGNFCRQHTPPVHVIQQVRRLLLRLRILHEHARFCRHKCGHFPRCLSPGRSARDYIVLLVSVSADRLPFQCTEPHLINAPYRVCSERHLHFMPTTARNSTNLPKCEGKDSCRPRRCSILSFSVSFLILCHFQFLLQWPVGSCAKVPIHCIVFQRANPSPCLRFIRAGHRGSKNFDATPGFPGEGPKLSFPP